MSDHPSGFSKRSAALVIIASALVSVFFGFVSGLVAGNQPLRDQVLSSLSPALAGYVSGLSSGRPAAKEQAAAPKEAAPGATDEEKTIAAVEKASPAVVSIVISKDVPVYEQYYANPFGDGSGDGSAAPNDFFQQFFGNNPALGLPQYRQKGTEHKEIGAGSGFFVSADGTIVTNKHVVADETADYTVIMQDGAKFPAKVLGRDPSNDIAVIKIEKPEGGKDFPFVPLGDSSTLKVGQGVIAIGYALGRFDNTASTGIVSGLDRRIQAGDGMNQAEDLFGIIQTDAAINPGNSGGPLLNLKGEAIGVNVAIVQGSQNIGFALPINDVRKVVDSVAKGGKISRPFLGVRYVMITKEFQDKNQLPVDHGALVARGQDSTELAVSPGSPADLAGIVENDIILEVDGKPLAEDYPLFVAVAKHNPGDKVTMKILHKGQQKTVEVTLGERK